MEQKARHCKEIRNTEIEMSGKKQQHSNAALDLDKESETEEQDGTSQGVDQASTTPGGVLHCVPRVVVFHTFINF